MLRNVLLGTVAVLVGSSFSAFAGPKEDVQAAAKKLSDAPSYSWTTTNESGFGTFSSQGKTQKEGNLIWQSSTFNENTTEIIKQGEKVAIKSEGSWKTLADLENAEGMGRFVARTAQNLRAPAAQAEEVVGKVKELQKSGDAFSGELTEEGAKDLLSFGGRRAGGQGPEYKNAKGTAKYWVKDGTLSKVEYKVSGSVTFNNEDRDLDRTTTIEFKDVGTTKIEVPSDAKAKLQ